MARSAALHEPPVACDYPLPPAAARDVSVVLAERAASRIIPLDRQDVASQAVTDPAAAGRRVLDDAEAKARAALAGRPAGSLDPAEIGRPRLADLLDRREAARDEAREAREAAAQHRVKHGPLARLLDSSARRRQASLDDEAQRLDRDSRRLDRGHDRAVSRIEKEAAKQARTNRAALDDWRYQPSVRRAERQLKGLANARRALEDGSPRTISALAGGDVRQAVAASTKWQAEAPERARQAEEDVERERRAGETPRETAIRLASNGERAVQDDPDALAQARGATAAALAEDPDTTEALMSGDPTETQAAARWQQRQEQERRGAQEWVTELAEDLAGPGGP